MDSLHSSKKVAAIYDLREAAEAKATAQVAVEMSSTPGSRSALLEAQLDLEAKTAEAVDACHDCDDETHDHAPRRSATVAPDRAEPESNVINVDFGTGSRSA